MNINIVRIPENLLQTGDELAVFDGDLCVGSLPNPSTGGALDSNQLPGENPQHQHSVIGNRKSQITNFTLSRAEGHKSEIRNLSIPASASDDDGIPGFAEGNNLIIKLWKASEGKEYTIKPEIISGVPVFQKHESVFVSLKNLKIREFENLKMDGKTGIRIFPNPSSGKVTIQADTNNLKDTRILVFNTLGQQVISKVICTNPEVIDFSGFVSGIYTIRVMGDSWSKTEKIILR